MMEIEYPHDICSTFVPFFKKQLSISEETGDYPGEYEETVNVSSNEPPLIDESLVYAFKILINKYRKRMGDTSDRIIVSGGLQQYLNKQHAIQKRNSLHQEGSRFHQLPVNIKLHIFSYLGAKQLCCISRVCRDWYNVSQDNLLWQGMLQRDINQWDVISHTTNPAVYQETQSEWSNKNIYLRCSPEINQLMHEDISLLTSITHLLRYFVPKKVPRITMFGPGLESDNNSAIIRNLLYEKNLLQRTGLVPGQFEGVGSGWGMKMEDGTAFQLSVLYSASKQVRQQEGWDRLQGNNLVQAGKDEAGQVVMELKPAVRDFCRTVDAFVYVIDATAEADSVDDGNQEFNAMVNERWSATHVPVLVLSCIKDSSVSRMPCIKVVEKLAMSTMNRPWQVRNSETAELTNVLEGLKWVVEQSQRR